MTRPVALLAAGLLLAAAGCRRPPETEGAPDVAVDAAGLHVRPDSHLLNHLQLSKVVASGKSEGLRMIGQIIALANPASDPTAGKIDWLELDPSVTRSVNLDLSRVRANVGDVVGLTELPLSYVRRIGPGTRVSVGRYGVSSKSEATVLFARTGIQWGEDAPVVFLIQGDSGWLPGSNCDVVFPLFRSQGVNIPTTALLHEGIHEYVLKVVGQDQFLPRTVTIGEGDPDQTEVVTGLSPSDRIVARGAILLKPFLHDWLESQGHPDAP